MNDIIMLTLGIAFAVLLFVTAYYWRLLVNGIPAAPFRGQLRRSGISLEHAEELVGTSTLRTAELKCALCASRAQCEAELPKGGKPPAHCPNTEVNRTLVW